MKILEKINFTKIIGNIILLALIVFGMWVSYFGAKMILLQSVVNFDIGPFSGATSFVGLVCIIIGTLFSGVSISVLIDLNPGNYKDKKEGGK